jgi:hypothetical protein
MFLSCRSKLLPQYYPKFDDVGVLGPQQYPGPSYNVMYLYNPNSFVSPAQAIGPSQPPVEIYIWPNQTDLMCAHVHVSGLQCSQWQHVAIYLDKKTTALLYPSTGAAHVTTSIPAI